MSVLRPSSPSGLAERRALLRERARHLRHHPTPSEARLWAVLRSGQLGVTFRRQVVVGEFIVDFLAPHCSLALEIDGDSYHARRRSADAARDRKLTRAGLHVLRIPASLVERHLEEALALVRDALGRWGR